ncbi:hypothetical protein E2562_037287 [Oryza meyeriana var. granulata]|uniref:Uncharacterized protein n=1 Tax=Oryza meyeriana var. granulata TaxID=110450 RepID=A0A6G1E8P7_9ORYZ|nr:hypothetical protein E2562_037287 [Oryza meyeriana var. granulata]
MTPGAGPWWLGSWSLRTLRSLAVAGRRLAATPPRMLAGRVHPSCSPARCDAAPARLPSPAAAAR